MIKQLIKSIFWKYINFKKRKERASYTKKKYGHLSNKEIFSTIYKNKIWNLNSKEEYDSGPGSHEDRIVIPYVNQIVKFLKNKKFNCNRFGLW